MPVDPVNPSDTPSTQGPNAPQEKLPPSSSRYTAQPRTFLGMHFTAKEWNKLMSICSQACASAIQHASARALKAIKKMGKDDPNSDDD